MPDLRQLLGYDHVVDQVAKGLQAGDGIQLLVGPPGVGKSWLAREIGREWDAAGGVALVAQGDSGRGDSAFYPFNYAMAGVSSGWKAAGSIASGVGRMAEAFIGTRGAITVTVETLAELPRKRRERRSKFLGEAAQQILHNLERQGKKKPTLLIADNLHWWDRESLDLLRMLLSSELQRAFPFLSRLRVLAVETAPPYQTVLHPRAHEDLIASARTRRFYLDRVQRERFRDVLVALGAPDTIDHGAADEIYTLSGAHLVLAQRAAEYMSGRGIDTLLAAADSEEFRRILLTERVHSLGSLGREATALLQVASALGLTFRQDEILCAHVGAESDTRRLLRSCRDERVLEVDEQTYRFVHDIFRQFFGSSDAVDNVSIHERLSLCLRTLRAADYDARSLNAVDAEQLPEAGILAVQAALQRNRNGDNWRIVLSESSLAAINACDLVAVLDLLVAARAALVRYDFAECQETLNRLPHGLGRALLAEADYIRAMCLMSTRSEDDRETGRNRLRQWVGLEDTEPELGLRLMRLLLYGLAMVRDKSEARALEQRIRSTLQSRVAFDMSAVDDLYTLDRCAGSLDVPDVALVRTREAERHFAPQAGETMVRRPVEYYRCLVNLGANLICNAEYADAVRVCERTIALVDEFEDGAFPRTDYPHSNGLLAQYRLGVVTAGQAVGQQRTIISNYGRAGDPFYADNALAVYLTLNSDFDEALSLFDDLDHRLKSTRRRPEPSMQYLIGANRCAARLLADTAEDVGSEWQKLSRLLDEVAYTTVPYLKRRHELLSSVFASRRPLTPIELDRYLPTHHPDEFGPLWDNYGRGFRLPEVEIWREN